MTDYCIYCECEPIDPVGWRVRSDLECICPWCIKEAVVCQICFEREASHQLPNETGYFCCYVCQLCVRDVEILSPI